MSEGAKQWLPANITVQGGGKSANRAVGANGVSTSNTASWNAFWTKANRDASWARGVSDGPI